MPIDKCAFNFEELASHELPRHFEALKKSMEPPLPATTFVGHKSASKGLLMKLNLTSDFPGCYVFIDEGKPFYVGISRTLIRRLTQHLNHKSHCSANLVYKMASKHCHQKVKRDQAMKEGPFGNVFNQYQQRLQGMRIAFIEIENDLELYLFEVYASMKLDTDPWNTFRTH